MSPSTFLRGALFPSSLFGRWWFSWFRLLTAGAASASSLASGPLLAVPSSGRQVRRSFCSVAASVSFTASRAKNSLVAAFLFGPFAIEIQFFFTHGARTGRFLPRSLAGAGLLALVLMRVADLVTPLAALAVLFVSSRTFLRAEPLGAPLLSLTVLEYSVPSALHAGSATLLAACVVMPS